MAQIVINEISQNYTYNIGTNSYATVALPITSCWGPGYFDPDTFYEGALSECEDPHEYMLEHTAWQRFPATQRGLESFVATYRGPASVYRRAKDYSYQMAMTLLTAGYDVLVCRLCPGTRAEGRFYQIKAGIKDDEVTANDKVGCEITFKAKYPGTFGNNLQVSLKKNIYFDSDSRQKRLYWSAITHVIDASGVKTSAENISFVFNADNVTEGVPYYKDVESNFWDIVLSGEPVEEGEADNMDSLGAVNVPYPVMPKAEGEGEAEPGQKPKGYNVEVQRLHFIRLSNGDDIQAPFDPENPTVRRPYSASSETSDQSMKTFERVVSARFEWAKLYNTDEDEKSYDKYPNILNPDTGAKSIDDFDPSDLEILFYKEWLYTHLVGRPLKDFGSSGLNSINYEGVFDLLKDKLAYNPNRVISSGWDDQDLSAYFGDSMSEMSAYMMNGMIADGEVCPETCLLPPSPLHLKLMDVAYHSRCATAFIDIPTVVDRKFVHIEDEYNLNREGYTQKLARVVPYNASMDVNGVLFHTHSALFAPWGQYMYVGVNRMTRACPSFLALMIQRAQILNQPDQYEWALPKNRKHNLRIGKMDYTVPKKILDRWQKLEGASLNVITAIPDLGTNIWGNSTLFEVPPATYQALANLSTRFLVNAVENVAYRCGIGITFQYNNEQAYNKFYAGVTPLLDTMKNVGAIEDYYVKMSADINGLDQVNANTVIGKIYLVVNGVINDIYVDLICLPPGVDLNQYRS